MGNGKVEWTQRNYTCTSLAICDVSTKLNSDRPNNHPARNIRCRTFKFLFPVVSLKNITHFFTTQIFCLFSRMCSLQWFLLYDISLNCYVIQRLFLSLHRVAPFDASSLITVTESGSTYLTSNHDCMISETLDFHEYL